MQIDILFEDEWLIVVNKPNNVLMHNSYYARNIKEPTLIQLLQEQTENTYYPIHRLDRKTSGVVALAKQKEDVASFQELFTSKDIHKEYIGLVRGFVTEEKTIDSPVKNPDTKVYKDALTKCLPINQIELEIPVHPYPKSRYSLVRLLPSTGRMHQLRIHMNKVSHPLVGDYKYGDRFHNRMFETEFDCHNLFLHALKLNFKHPKTLAVLEFTAKLPNDWHKIFNKFGWKNPI